jgi:hypothetical protein
MGLKTIILFTVLSSLFIQPVKGQPAGVQTAGSFVREEVSLHTDRTLYLSGEHIWFNAYCSIVDASAGSQLSNVLYVELYLNKQAVVKKKFQIVGGNVQGMLTIPEEIPSANYYLRAYTQYQRNFAPETFFTTLLTIINPEIPLRKSKTRLVKLVEIVPEGGQMLPGLPVKIAAQINTSLIDIIEESLLINQYNDSLKSLRFAANGLALFEFTPVDTLDYFLMFRLNTGDTVTEALPKKEGNGIVISENLKKREVYLYSIPAYRKTNKPEHQLLLYSANGTKKFSKAVFINKPKQSIAFEYSRLDEGFYYLVLLNSKEEVVARTTMYQPFRPVSISVNTQKKVFGPRQQVQLSLGREQEDGIVKADLTVSVVKKGTTFSFDKNLPLSIIENPLLLSALACGRDMTDSVISAQLKAVLILNRDYFNVQKNSRQLLDGSNGEITCLPEIRDVSLSGIVRNAKTRQALSDVWVFASVLGSDAQFHAYKTRENGGFIFSLNKLNHTHNLALVMDSIEGVETEFLIYNDFSDKWPVAKDIPLKIDSAQRILLESMFVNHQLANMFRPKEKLVERTGNSLPFPFTDLHASIKLKDFVALPTMPEVINELVPYLHVRKRKGKHVLAVLDNNRKNVYEHPLILVDNLPVFNVEEILAINPAKIERIDVIGKVYSYGDLLIEGIVMFHTKTDNFAGIQLPPASVFVEYQTITPSASVEFPVYNPENETPAHSPDFKNLLYWNPSVPFYGNDNTITFYTADEKTNYEIVVSGKTADGRPVFGKCEIRVE